MPLFMVDGLNGLSLATVVEPVELESDPLTGNVTAQGTHLNLLRFTGSVEVVGH